MKRLNRQNINTKDFWDLQWRVAPPIDWRDRRYETMANYAREGDVVLDIGCGRGELAFITKQIRPSCSVFGTDISEEGLCYAKFNFPGITWEKAGAYNQPFKDGLFDVVFCGELLEHLEEPQKLIDECYRLLKDNGRLVLTCPYRDAMVVPEHLWVFDGEDISEMGKSFKETWFIPWASGRRLINVQTGETTHPPGVFDILLFLAVK